MTVTDKPRITVETQVNAPIEKVWECWTKPEYITQWNYASDDWHSPRAANDLRVGGRFSSRMEAKDGSFGFDFSGTYDEVTSLQKIVYTIDDDRKVVILFTNEGGTTSISETFEAESTHPLEMQKGGWQAILNNFKRFVESGA